MFTADRDAYVRAATGAMLTGQPFESLADACRRQAAEEAAAKVVSFADMRTKLRPLLTAATTER
jgi:dihydroxyacid dehydratase/phosphogluconate dehydratase